MSIFHQIYFTAEEAVDLSLSYFTDTDKRVHVLYLFSSLLLAYYVYIKSDVRMSFLKYLFPKKVWLATSAFVDYSFFFFNSFIKIIFIGPYIIVGFYIAHYTNEYLIQFLGFPSYSLGVFHTILLYTISLTIINDFITYLIHLCMHKIPFLWEFHKIHHSATVLNPITQYRIHPIELIINNVRSILIFGFITGFFDYLSAHSIDKLLFLGANLFHFVFLLFGANLRHSHVKLRYFKFLEFIFISPFQHQIHHSRDPQHFNKNLGSKFALWDWLFGTLVLSEKVETLRFGISEDKNSYESLYRSIITPFINLYKSMINLVKNIM